MQELAAGDHIEVNVLQRVVVVDAGVGQQSAVVILWFDDDGVGARRIGRDADVVAQPWLETAHIVDDGAPDPIIANQRLQADIDPQPIERQPGVGHSATGRIGYVADFINFPGVDDLLGLQRRQVRQDIEGDMARDYDIGWHQPPLRSASRTESEIIAPLTAKP